VLQQSLHATECTPVYLHDITYINNEDAEKYKAHHAYDKNVTSFTSHFCSK